MAGMSIVALALALTAKGQEPGPGVWVPPVVVQGEAPVAAGGRLDEAVRKGVERHRLPAVDGPLERQPPCSDAACWAERTRAAGAAYVVVVRARIRDRDYGFDLELRDGRTGNVLESATPRCDVCGLDEVAELLQDQVALLVDRGLARARAQPVLVVRSDPPGARILVDGDDRGPAPQTLTLRPGVHTIRLEHPGYNPVQQEVRLAPGVRTETRLALLPVLVSDGGGRRAQIGGGVLVGAGTLALGAGWTLLALDGRPNRARCSGANVDADGDCRFVYRTKWGGAVALAVGAAALSAGVTWLLGAHARARHPARREHAARTARSRHP